MSYKVKFIKEAEIKKKKTILEVAKDLGIKIKSPCDGKGKCGKCIARVLSGQVSELSKTEEKLLTKKKLEDGYRLACETKILGDVEIELVND